MNGQTCGSPTEYTVPQINYLRSVFGRSLQGVLSPRTIPYCDANPTVNIAITPMDILNTGTIGKPTLATSERYEWILPAGWKQATTNSTGTIYTTTPNISIQPSNPSGACSPGGEVKVRAVAGGFTNCIGLPFSTSNESKIVLNRTPAFSLIPPSGYTGQKCGQRQAVTFSVTALPCVSQYSWTYPPGWTGPATTSTNSATVNPLDNGGNITASVNTGSCTISATYSISYTPTVPMPAVSNTGGTYEWCNYETFLFTATPPAGYNTNFGYDWYGTGTILMNGVAATYSSPFHTTTNSVTVTIGGSDFGSRTIGVRMNNGICTASGYNGYTKRVGPYSNSEFSIIGPTLVCANSVADFRPNFITPDLTGYQWSAPSGWSASGQGTPYFHVSIPGQFFGGAITLRLQNRCGLTNTPYVLNLSNGCGFSFLMSPNPSEKTLIIAELDTSNEVTILLIDKNNQTITKFVTKEGRIEIDVSQIPNGIYILAVTQRGKTETQQIVISH